jgi:phosphatidylserine/phosphatidylglycerophosphate/cardiolipin synthase-like enzyme
VYVWPLDKRPKDGAGRHGSLHAKCAVADEAAAFISSANLTKYALNLNAQKGVYAATLPTKCWF